MSSVRRGVCANPGWLRRHGVPARPEQLAERPCVRLLGLAPASTWPFQVGGRPLSVAAGGGFATDPAAAAVGACAAGLGFGPFLPHQVEIQIRARRLRVVLEKYEPKPIPVSLLRPDARLRTPRERVFLTWMKPALRSRLAGATARSPRPRA